MGGRFNHDIGSTGAPYPTRAALDAITITKQANRSVLTGSPLT